MLRTAENVTLRDKNGLPVVVNKQDKDPLGCLMGGVV